jgi:cytoskeletal protein RodZ
MSASTPDPVYSDLEVDPHHFAEGQLHVHRQISYIVSPTEERTVCREHQSELQPDGEILDHDSREKQTRRRRCGLSPSKFWIVLGLLGVIIIGAIVGVVIVTTQRLNHSGREQIQRVPKHGAADHDTSLEEQEDIPEPHEPSVTIGSSAASNLETIRQKYNVPGLAVGLLA